MTLPNEAGASLGVKYLQGLEVNFHPPASENKRNEILNVLLNNAILKIHFYKLNPAKMKKLICIFLLALFASYSFADKNPFHFTTDNSFQIQRVLMDMNNIGAWFQNTGIYNQDTRTSNTPGFEWLKSSGKFAIFTSGLSISGFINGSLSQIMGSYSGELAPGIIMNDSGVTGAEFKIYSIKTGDTSSTNPDYANWGFIVPYGAPYEDINNNGQYDPGVDIPGVKGASQTIFATLTGGFASSRNVSEGFGGGISNPLMLADVRFTSWCYDDSRLSDVQFQKWEVINQSSNQVWERLRIALVSDPDLGDATNDYIGCDTTLQLGYCYNGVAHDGNGNGNTYGFPPPAVGKILLKGPVDKTSQTDYSFTSFVKFTNTGSAPPPCESDPNGEPLGAHFFMSGLKKDSTDWIDRLSGEKTRFVYTGDPETLSGWTEFRGSVQNCNGSLTGPTVNLNPPGDRRFVIGSGSEDFSMQPGDTQTIIAAQLIRKGNSYINSVEKLKEYADSIITFYNNGYVINVSNISSEIPEKFALHQNFPNPFNPVTKIVFELTSREFVKLELFDVTGRLVSELISTELTPGTYSYELNANNMNSGVYFYRLSSENYSETKRLVLVK